jgi:DNA-binding CsgD family transcriptional regulator
VAAQLLIFDPKGHSYPSARSLIRQYGLTEAEARMLLAFVRTQGIQEAADDLGVSPETARSHLKAIFAKTGANSQAKLMHLVLKHPESVVGEVMSFGR